MAARPSWEGSLTFNLISMPVKAYNAVGPGGKIGFHLLHAKCNERIRYKKVCPIHGEVSNEEIVSGYEVAKGKYVPVRREERAGLRAADDKTVAIDAFVTPDSIDPVYFSGRTFYLVPATPAAQKPFAVLMDAMNGLARHAVARVVLSGRGHVAVVRPFGRLLGMTLLSFSDEVKSPAPFEAEVGSPAVSADERKLAEAVVKSATTEFDLTRYRDDYAAKLAKLLQAKTRGKVVAAKVADESDKETDLMEALRKSLSPQGHGARRRLRATRKVRPGRRPKRAVRTRFRAVA